MASRTSPTTRRHDPEHSPGFLIWVVTNRWQAAQRAALKPIDLTPVQLVLLVGLSGLEDPVSQLVRREPDQHDGRAWAVAVTPAGRRLAKRAARAVERCDAEFVALLGTQAKAFAGHLRTLKEGTEE
jgi:hypothetical protein